MSAHGIEVGSAYVTLLAKAPGISKSINSALGSVDTSKASRRIGEQMAGEVGKSLKSRVAKQFADATAAALDKQTQATKKLSDAEHSLVKARAKHGSTSAKVTAAEEKLKQLRASGKASAADLESAEAAVEKARADSAGTRRAVADGQNRVAEATRNAADASKEYADAVEREGSRAARSQEWTKLAVARMDDLSSRWKDAGAKITGVGETLASKLTKPVTVAGGAVATLVGALGFKRLVGIDTARGQFQGLGMDADAVMAQVDRGVTNTALSMAQGASLAVGILATGAVPLSGLEAQIKRVSNVSAAYGVESEHAAYLLNNILTKNKVTWGDLSQMQQNQIPIVTQLADYYGVAGDEIMKMAQNGEISVEDLNKTLDQNAGAAAESYAGTWKGITSNILSNLGKIGAKFLEPTFNIMKEEAAGFLGLLKSDEFSTFATDAADNISRFVSASIEKVRELIDWWGQLSPGVKKAIGVFAGVLLVAGPVLIVFGKLATGVGAILNIVKVLIPVISTLFKVMFANPLGLIITAVVALVSGLVWFFTKTKTGQKIWGEFTRFLGEAWANVSRFFQDTWNNVLKPVFDKVAEIAKWLWDTILKPIFDVIAFSFSVMAGLLVGTYEALIKPVFAAIGKIIGWLWNNIVKPYFGLIKAHFQVIGNIVSWLWTTKVQPVFNFIGNLIRAVWNGFIKPAFSAIWTVIKNTLGPVFTWLRDNVIKPVWDAISLTISTVWGKIKKVIDVMVKIVRSDPKKAFETARDGIKTAWEAIKEIAKKPVRFVVETVFGGLVGAVNKFLPKGMQLPTPKLPKGFSAGGYTGNLPTSAVAGVVHGDEHVIRAASRRSIEARHPGLLDHMNRTGTIPGYRKGGLVHPLPGSVIATQWMGYPGHTGMDFAKPLGTPIQAAAAGVVSKQFYHHNYGNMVDVNHGAGFSTRYAHMLSNVAVRLGQAVKAGQVLGYEGSTGNSTGPHLHFETLQNGNPMNPAPFLSGAASVKPAFGIVEGLLDGAISKFKGAFPDGGFFVDAAGSVMKSAVKGAVDWIGEKLSFGVGGGGLIPTLYDNGGWLQPGTHLVQNKTGRPEPIFTGNQFDRMVAGGRGDVYVQNPFTGEYLLAQVDGRADAAVDRGMRDNAASLRAAAYR